MVSKKIYFEREFGKLVLFHALLRVTKHAICIYPKHRSTERDLRAMYENQVELLRN